MVLLAFVANRLGFLDVAGSLAALAMGLVILTAAGPGWLLLLFLFAGLGFLATRLGRRRKRRLGAAREGEERGWRNVAGNGATATAVAAAAWFVPADVVAFPFAVAVAVAAADTVASEVGSLSPRAVLITRPTRRVPVGTDGGVSVLGTTASAGAALLFAALALVLLPLEARLLPLVAAAGLAGSLLDSLLGALWEASPPRPGRPLSKTQVNLAAVSLPTLVALGYALLR